MSQGLLVNVQLNTLNSHVDSPQTLESHPYQHNIVYFKHPALGKRIVVGGSRLIASDDSTRPVSHLRGKHLGYHICCCKLSTTLKNYFYYIFLIDLEKKCS